MITKDILSRKDIPESEKASIEFLLTELGTINDSQVGNLLKVAQTSVERLRAKLDFLYSIGFDKKAIADSLVILNLSEENNVKNKIVFLKEFLEFSDEDIASSANLIALDYKLIVAKYRFFVENLGFGKQHFKHYPKLFELDCASDESKQTSVRSKINFYKRTLGYSQKQFQQNPVLLNYDCLSDETAPGSVQYKIKFYEKYLGFTILDFQAHPKCFDYDCSLDNKSSKSIIAKIKYYTENLGFAIEEIKDNFDLLRLDIANGQNPNAVPNKIKKLQEIGISIQDIREDPRLLFIPVADIKDKYVLWCTICPDKSFLKKNKWYVTSPEKVYARYQYLILEGVALAKGLSDGSLITALNRGEKEFVRRFKMDSDTLMKKYPLDEVTLAGLYKQYAELKIEPAVQKDA